MGYPDDQREHALELYNEIHSVSEVYADAPNQKWLADITKFAIPAGKLYSSSTQAPS